MTNNQLNALALLLLIILTAILVMGGFAIWRLERIEMLLLDGLTL